MAFAIINHVGHVRIIYIVECILHTPMLDLKIMKPAQRKKYIYKKIRHEGENSREKKNEMSSFKVNTRSLVTYLCRVLSRQRSTSWFGTSTSSINIRMWTRGSSQKGEGEKGIRSHWFSTNNFSIPPRIIEKPIHMLLMYPQFSIHIFMFM